MGVPADADTITGSSPTGVRTTIGPALLPRGTVAVRVPELLASTVPAGAAHGYRMPRVGAVDAGAVVEVFLARVAASAVLAGFAVARPSREGGAVFAVHAWGGGVQLVPVVDVAAVFADAGVLGHHC